MDKEQKEKNILDLTYQKYLQYFNTSIILLFTYGIAVFIAFLTKQLILESIVEFLLFSFFSAIVLTPIITLMGFSKKKINQILEDIKNLGK